MKSLAVTVAAVCGLFAGVSASRADTWNVQVRFAPAGVNDIHLLFSGTGGNIVNRAAVFPVATVFPGGQPGNEVNATFPPLAAGGIFQAQFDLPSPLTPVYAGGNWTLDGVNAGNIPVNDVTITPAPGGVGLLAVGCFVGSRRRRVT